MLAFDFFNAPCYEESDDLVKSRGDYPHVMDPRSAEDHVVGRGAVKHYKGDMEVDFGYVNWEGDVPQCDFYLPLNPTRTVKRQWI